MKPASIVVPFTTNRNSVALGWVWGLFIPHGLKREFPSERVEGGLPKVTYAI